MFNPAIGLICIVGKGLVGALYEAYATGKQTEVTMVEGRIARVQQLWKKYRCPACSDFFAFEFQVAHHCISLCGVAC